MMVAMRSGTETRPSPGGASGRPVASGSPPDRGDPSGHAFVAGLVAASAAMAISAVVHAFAGSVPFLPLAIAQVLVRTTSGGVDSFFIDRLGHWASRLAVAGVCLGFFLAGGFLGRLVPRISRGDGRRFVWAGAGSLAPLWAASVVLYPVAPQYLGRWAFAGVSALMYATGGAVGGIAYGRQQARAPLRPVPPRRGATATDPSRRYFLASLVVGGVAGAAGVLDLGRLVRPVQDPTTLALDLPSLTRATRPPAAPGDVAFDAIRGLSPEITPTSRFYVVNEELVYPRLDVAGWRLSVGGEVDHPMDLSFTALTRLPAVERFQTLECISNEVGGEYISTGRFTGIPLWEILHRAGVRPGAAEVVFASASGYADSLPIRTAMDPTTLIVVALNGRPLPTEHGFPARLLAVGNYGMKNPKWLTKIQVVKQPYEGFWERRGWSRQAIVRTNSRIDVPSSGARTKGVTVIAGVAFAGARGISKVEVSLDSGRTWDAATLKTALSPFTWRLWRFDPGPTQLADARSAMVRAYDGTGAVQAVTRADPFPQGSAGYHTVALRP